MAPYPTPAELPVQPINLLAADEGEELQRAELYGLLAQLWLAAPDAAMLQQFAEIGRASCRERVCYPV